jgi:hypothetical protein
MRFQQILMTTAMIGALGACGKKKGEAPPAKPANGAPMVFQVTKVVPGEAFKSEIDVHAYNFSDQKIASYWVLVRFKDSAGNIVRSPDALGDRYFGQWQFSGMKYMCAPTSWCDLRLDPPVPSTAASAEVVAFSLTAVDADGVHMANQPLFKLPDMTWPK